MTKLTYIIFLKVSIDFFISNLHIKFIQQNISWRLWLISFGFILFNFLNIYLQMEFSYIALFYNFTIVVPKF